MTDDSRERNRLEQIRDELARLARQVEQGAFKRWGIGLSAVEVGLRADQEPLAAELRARYGDAIRLTVGSKPYPPDQHATENGSEVGHWSPTRTEVSIQGLELHLELATPAVRPGEDGRGELRISNVGTDPIEFASEQPLVALVTDPSSGESVGCFTGAIAGTGLTIRLNPGESTSINVIFGTGSMREGREYALPRGQYLVATDLPVFPWPPTTGPQRRVMRVTPAVLSVQ